MHKPCFVCPYGYRYFNAILEIFTASLKDHLWKWLKSAWVYILGGEFSRTSEITSKMTFLKVFVPSNRNQNFVKAGRTLSEESRWVGQGSSGKKVPPLHHGDEGSSAKGKEK